MRDAIEVVSTWNMLVRVSDILVRCEKVLTCVPEVELADVCGLVCQAHEAFQADHERRRDLGKLIAGIKSDLIRMWRFVRNYWRLTAIAKEGRPGGA